VFHVIDINTGGLFANSNPINLHRKPSAGEDFVFAQTYQELSVKSILPPLRSTAHLLSRLATKLLLFSVTTATR